MRISDWSSDVCSSDLNDAWAPVPAERHPKALGRPAREVWADIWDVIGPQFEKVIAEGEGFSTFDRMLPMVRDGAVRETYWNYSFTPIRGESGAVAGVFNQGHETDRKSTRLNFQSLMRISYAVFCLKKKKKQTNT